MSILAALILLAAPLAQAATIPFSPETFVAGEGARWGVQEVEGIDMTDEFISPPRAGQDRDGWLQALREYRRVVREGGRTAVLNLNFDGLRAWTRLSLVSSRALALRPGDVLEVCVAARWREGNGELCAAFDLLHPETHAWEGWSGVLAVAPVPRDGAWHQQSFLVEVPRDLSSTALLRPIFGMDATHDNTPGVIDIRNLTVGPPKGAGGSVALEVCADAPSPQAIPPLDRSFYARPDLAWSQQIFTCHFTFMYDRSFYDPQRGYLVEEFLEDGRREFGGYDAIVLWQGYPRLGIDDRNQFDMYGDMPGGVAGLREVVARFHAAGVKVFIDYNPWDVGTRRPAQADEDMLAGLVAAIDADGVFLDTLSAASPSLRQKVDAARPGVVIAPEIHPPVDQLSLLSLSWGQWMNDPRPPGMFHLKWVEPRHLQHQVRRWDKSHRTEIESAFFNGSGMLVWENIFASYNPWSAEDRALWRRCVPVLRAFQAPFTSDAWDPFYPTQQAGLYAHRWPGDAGETVFTLRRVGEPATGEQAVLEVDAAEVADEVVTVDLWARRAARVVLEGEKARIFAEVGTLGAVAILRKDDPRVVQFLAEEVYVASAQDRARDPLPVATLGPGVARDASERPALQEGMVLVAGGSVRMQLTHQRRECGCYPDPDTPPADYPRFLTGENFHLDLSHDFSVDVAPFFIDEAEVTNREFAAFQEATGYTPAHAENFLKHWPGGAMPETLADHPVVYVDLEDARAYAAWAGKRLPAEAEWHLAAGGPEGMAWPWGPAFDAARVNLSGATVPALSMPEGRSPAGCYHMSGNVWEWTEPGYDDGHTRFAMIRGGSFYQVGGSDWYAPGGPQPNTRHTKFVLMWPGLDRCATVGFRCVRGAG